MFKIQIKRGGRGERGRREKEEEEEEIAANVKRVFFFIEISSQ